MKSIFFAAVVSFIISVPAAAQRELTGFEEGFFRKGIEANTQSGPNNSVIRGDAERSLLFIDARNDRVGVSTGTPVYSLDVNGTIYTSSDVRAGFFRGDGSALTAVTVATATLPNTYTTSMTWRGAGIEVASATAKITGNASVSFQIGASTLAVLGSGSIGVGTAAPDTPFHVLQSGNVSTIFGTDTVAAFQNTAADSTNARISVMSGTNAAAILQLGDTDAESRGRIQYSNNVDSLEFHTAGTERMWIGPTGNVGIGISNPTAPLQVIGASNLTGVVTVGASTLTVGGNAFSVGGSTLDVRSSSITIGGNDPGSLLTVYGSAQFGTAATISTFSRTGALAMPANADLTMGSSGEAFVRSSVTIGNITSPDQAMLQIFGSATSLAPSASGVLLYARGGSAARMCVESDAGIESCQGATATRADIGPPNNDVTTLMGMGFDSNDGFFFTFVPSQDKVVLDGNNGVAFTDFHLSSGSLNVGGNHPTPFQIGASSVVVTGGGFFGIGISTGQPRFIVAMPAAQTIAAADVITADACGTLKRITAGGAVTTNTVDTFTPSSSLTEGCCMDVVNTGANAITLDTNAEFFSAGAADVVLGTRDSVRVCSDGTVWTQVGDTGNN